MSNHQKKALIIYLYPWMTIPVLISLVKMMTSEGWKVTILTIKSENPTTDAGFGENVNFQTIEGKFSKNILHLLNISINCVRSLPKVLAGRRYDLIFGAQTNSLFLAVFLGKILRKPVIYISLELFFLNELHLRSWRMYKRMETWFSKQTLFIISQDPWRCEQFAKENWIDIEKMISLPNTDLGPACLEDSTVMHARLGLPEDNKIILYPAGYTPERLLDRLDEVAKDLPEGWRIVIHRPYYASYQKENMDDCYKQIIFSRIPFPFSQLKDVYSSATIGFAWHFKDQRPGGGKNQDYIGYSSGKFNMFIQYGKPVITSNQVTFKEIFKEYQCGIAIDSFEEIGGAIRTIMSDIDKFKSEAIRFYNERLCFEGYYNNLMNKIKYYKG